jgi:hypothetical protein
LVPNSNNGGKVRSKLRCFQFVGLNFEKWKGKKMRYYLPTWPKFWEVGNFWVPIGCFAMFRHQFNPPPAAGRFQKGRVGLERGFAFWPRLATLSLGRLDQWPAFWVGRPPARWPQVKQTLLIPYPTDSDDLLYRSLTFWLQVKQQISLLTNSDDRLLRSLSLTQMTSVVVTSRTYSQLRPRSRLGYLLPPNY